jgi:2-oxoglutarate dehydrogenase E2 component (dihydrolipoamide succinyltransferase)
MIDVTVPMEQEGTQAVVRAWLKKVGDRVEVNDPLVELETDKVAVEVPSPAAGVLREILLDSNAEAVPGAVLGRIAVTGEVSGNEPEPVRAEPVEALPFEPSKEGGQPFDKLRANGLREMRLSPSVKRACLQHGIDPSTIQGTGRDGRVTRADVDQAVQAAAKAPKAAPSVPPSDSSIASRSIPHDRMRLRIAENMLNSVTQAPRGREAHLHGLHRSSCGGGDEGCAGDQQPLAR